MTPVTPVWHRLDTKDVRSVTAMGSPGASDEVETAEVAIPEGLRPGDSFSVQATWGGVFQVEVPPGTQPGSTLFVEYPRHPQPSTTLTPSEAPAAARLQLHV